MGEHVKVEIGAVTVGAEHEVCQMLQYSVLLQSLNTARGVGKHEGEPRALQAPEPAQGFVDVHARLVHAGALLLGDV